MNSHTELIERLKPCPFCGGEAEMYEGHRDHWKVRCTSCGALPGRWFAREGAQLKAVKLWNTRTNDQAISTLTAALEDARKRFQMIADFGDPYEINDEPEDFGGTDDGAETVCMAYENMQCIAENALRSISAALKGEGTDQCSQSR